MPRVMREPAGDARRWSFARTAAAFLLLNLALALWTLIAVVAVQRVPCEIAGQVVERCQPAHAWAEAAGFITAVGATLGGAAAALYGTNKGATALGRVRPESEGEGDERD